MKQTTNFFSALLYTNKHKILLLLLLLIKTTTEKRKPLLFCNFNEQKKEWKLSDSCIIFIMQNLVIYKKFIHSFFLLKFFFSKVTSQSLDYIIRTSFLFTKKKTSYVLEVSWIIMIMHYYLSGCYAQP